MGKAGVKRILAVCVLAWAMVIGAAPPSPVEAAGRHRMSFVPGERSRPAKRMHHGSGRGRVVRHGYRHGTRHATHGRRSQRAAARHASQGGDREIRAAPGGGFTLQDGVLTYPAPARFQPRNLPHR
jgi:hypothetical protein